MSFASELVQSLSRPSSKNQTAEGALIRGLSHSVAGASIAILAGVEWWAIGLAYLLIKEIFIDLIWRDGDPVDGGFDTAFVTLGATTWAYWEPVSVLLGLSHGYYVWKTRPGTPISS